MTRLPLTLMVLMKKHVVKLDKVPPPWIYPVASAGTGALAAGGFRMINADDK